MAKKKAAVSKAVVGLDQTLVGQTVCFAGVPSLPNGNEHVATLVQRRGGTMVDDVGPELSFLVLGKSGFSAARVRAEKLNADERADITILSEQEFQRQLTPTREEVVALLTGGPASAAALCDLLQTLDTTWPDLSGSDLRETRFADDTPLADLEKLTLKDVDLRGAHLVNVWFPSLPGVKLDGAVFERCHVAGECEFAGGSFKKGTAPGADFGSCDIDRADFGGTDLSAAEFSSTVGSDVVFKKAKLPLADFSQCELSHADFTSVDADGADFCGARLTNAIFTKASLRNARFSGAELRDCDFTGADLREADLTGADLRGCNLKNARFKGAALSLAELDLASFNDTADLPADAVDTISKVGPALRELHEALSRIARVEFTLPLRVQRERVNVAVSTSLKYARLTWDETPEGASDVRAKLLRGHDIRAPLLSLARRFSSAVFLADEVEVRSGKGPTGTRLPKRLVISAVCEVLGQEPPEELPPPPLPSPLAVAVSKPEPVIEAPDVVRTRLLGYLRGGEPGISKWNSSTDEERELVSDLREQDLSGLNLSGINLRHCDLSGSNLSTADLSRSDLSYCRFRGANLGQARLNDLKIWGANFQKANLRGAAMTGSELLGVNFQEADLREADFSHSSILNSDLRGADLRECIHTSALFPSTRYDAGTQWPSDFDFEVQLAALDVAPAENASSGSGVQFEREQEGDVPQASGDGPEIDADEVDDEELNDADHSDEYDDEFDDYEDDEYEDEDDDDDESFGAETDASATRGGMSGSDDLEDEEELDRNESDEDESDVEDAEESTADETEDAEPVPVSKPEPTVDISDFLDDLQELVSSGKLDKAVDMLKEDRFRLFAEVLSDSLTGVVKSQTDADLVYSCRLSSDGTYGCCTQNLNTCGGLRGSLCKHLLVLIIGLVRAGELEAGVVRKWIKESLGKKPLLNKDQMGEVFLRYKGAEAGEIDWRPTETLPEDYYAV